MRAFLHKHSTLYGLSAAAMVGVIVAMAVQWQYPNVIFAVVAAMGGLALFPRFFYGLAESKVVDTEKARAFDPE